MKDASGKLIHEGVWRYLYTHPVEQTGQPVAVIVIVMAIYLVISLLTSVLMNLYNRAVQIPER